MSSPISPPNETRRVDLVFSIGYDDDIPNAIRVLKDAVAAHPLTLEEPAPTIAVVALAESSVDILCGPWVKSGDYLTVYRALTADVKARFDAAGITIPYPQRELHLRIADATAVNGALGKQHPGLNEAPTR
jgi:small conductance mechanosensitive channel